MINKELLPKNTLPLYEVEEVSMLDAMILLKGYGKSTGESSIARAAERIKSRSDRHPGEHGWSMTGS